MPPTTLKIISLNIELDRHFDRIIPFFEQQQPDVILLQEVLEKDIFFLEKSTDMESVYCTQNILGLKHGDFMLGMLTLSKLPITQHTMQYYRRDSSNFPSRRLEGEPELTTRALSITKIAKEQQPFFLVNTHFTWSPNAKPNKDQQIDLPIMCQQLNELPEFILCGDFNAPRGTLIFDTLASQYHDNIPTQITTTIDKNLHKAGDLSIVVDGLFTTPHYQTEDVQIVDGLSDHCAIVATVHRNHAT